MKGCLVIGGFLLGGAALMIGVVVVLGRIGASETEPLTQQATQVEVTSSISDPRGSAGRIINGSEIEYRYDGDGRSFTSSTWLSTTELDNVDVCFDPDDPAVHTIRTNPEATCGDDAVGSNGVRQAEAAS